MSETHKPRRKKSYPTKTTKENYFSLDLENQTRDDASLKRCTHCFRKVRVLKDVVLTEDGVQVAINGACQECVRHIIVRIEYFLKWAAN